MYVAQFATGITITSTDNNHNIFIFTSPKKSNLLGSENARFITVFHSPPLDPTEPATYNTGYSGAYLRHYYWFRSAGRERGYTARCIFQLKNILG
jgi:hypothetical protein